MSVLKRMPYRRTTATLLAMALLYVYAISASAQNDNGLGHNGLDDENNTPMFSFSGFGTLGVVHSSEDQADFTSSVFKPNGAGYTRSWSADVDSLLGGQLTATFTPQLSAVVQIIVEQDYDNAYRPQVEWANIKYQFTPDFFVRAGRVVLPNFMASDYRKVGFITPWVRPPIEVYNLVPITKNDGIDSNYRLRFGEVTNTIQAVYGQLTTTDKNGSDVKGRDQWGLFNTMEYGPWTMRLGYYQTRTTLEEFKPFFDTFRLFGPEGTALADRYDCDDKLITLASVGASYDPGDWFLTGELARREADCFAGDNTAWYISGGYRFGKITPYLTYAQVKATSNTSDPGLDVSTLPPELVGIATGLNAGLNSMLAASPEQQSISIGARWDFMDNAAFKLQFDHVRLGDNSPGVLTNIQPNFQPGGSFNVFSATINFVF